MANHKSTKADDDDFDMDIGPQKSAAPKTEPAKPDKKEHAKGSATHGTIRVSGTPSDDKRLYQTAPELKEYLTKSEAEEKGFYWKD